MIYIYAGKGTKTKKKTYADLDTLNKLVTDITYAISQETIKTDKKSMALYILFIYFSKFFSINEKILSSYRRRQKPLWIIMYLGNTVFVSDEKKQKNYCTHDM